MRMRDFNGKKIVALARNGDYAHSGEEEAIEITLAEIPKDNKQEVLDVGCGLGGTAMYIQQHGWGQVTGTDIDSEAISYAKKKYPQISFHTCDVVNLPQLFNRCFDILTIFSAFYAFNDQKLALAAMRQVSKKNSRLIIFERVDCSLGSNFYQENQDNFPLVFPAIERTLAKTGWKFSHFKNLDKEFCQWQKNLIQKIIYKKDKITKLYSEEAFDHAIKTYTTALKHSEQGILGGGTLYAIAE